MRDNALRIGPIEPPPDRGRLMTAPEIAEEFFRNRVESRWVMEHVPCKVRFGHRTVFFYENDVKTWIEQHRSEVA